jgi:uncharacterized protein YeaO (DUF488 family)
MREELKNNADKIEIIKSKAGAGTVTLLYAARDQKHNEAVVLKEVLERS